MQAAAEQKCAFDVVVLRFAQFMEIISYEEEFLNSQNNKAVYFGKRNERLPLTYIHMAVNVLSSYVHAIYYYNGKQKKFFFETKIAISHTATGGSFVNDLATSPEFKRKLEIAVARLNGILGYFCILNPSYSKEYKIEGVKDIGFEKVEIIDEKKGEYADIVSQLPVKIKCTDVIWIFRNQGDSSLPNYDVWERYIFQENICHSELKQKLKTLKNVPNFIISQKGIVKKTVFYNELRHYFPDSLFCSYIKGLFYYEKPLIIEYIQLVADKYRYPLFHSDECISKKIAVDDVKQNFTEKIELISPKKENEKLNDQVLHLNKNGMIYEFQKSISINNENIYAVGIDLGTSTCCAAVNRKNGITTIHLDNKGERLLPSYVAYDEKTPIFGQVVINRLRQFSRSTVFDSKRIIGKNINDIEIDSNWPYRISEENGKVVIEIKKCNVSIQITAEDVAADLLKYMKQKSEEYQGTKLDNVVITVPAAFTEAQKEATIRAARLAGWKNINLLPEPIAAAFAYFTNKNIPENETIMIFDLGGGTLDVCIFKILNNQIRIISNTGDTKLGGRDFDTVLFNNFRNQLDVKHEISLRRDKKFKLITECQQIKEDLSTVTCRHLNIDEYDTTKDGTIAINRSDFENMTKPLLNKIKNTVDAALLNAKQNPENINKILLVGGGSRMPMIKTLLQEMFSKAEQCIHENPDEVVAIGAAYYAYSIYSKKKICCYLISFTFTKILLL